MRRENVKTSTRVYRYGCRNPSDPRLAEQLLGQASNYREDLRRAYNDAASLRRAHASGLAEAAHVRAYEEHEDAHDEVSHLRARDKALAYGALDERRNTSIREARARRGHLLDAGTYWLIEAAMLQAAKTTHGDPISRERWDGTGRIGAAIQADRQFPTSTWDHPRCSLTTPCSKGYAVLSIQVGVAKERRSISWPIKLHRPLPPDGVVKQVAVQRIRAGHRFRWEALITIEARLERLDATACGVVGVDVGWRNEGELGQRVATWDASDDADVLRIDTLDSFLYSDDVRGTRDRCFDEAKAYAQENGVPGAEHAKMWKDKARLVRVAGKIGNLGLAWWVEVDRHLEDIECGVRVKAMRRRLDAYRRFADALARRYEVVALEDMPMQDWVGEGETSRRERRRSAAALSLLQGTLADRFGPTRTDWVPCAYTTMTCAACQVTRTERVGAAAYWTCSCGKEHHQDANASEVIRQDSERWLGGGNPPRARSRKARKKLRKEEKGDAKRTTEKASEDTARKEVSEAAE